MLILGIIAIILMLVAPKGVMGYLSNALDGMCFDSAHMKAPALPSDIEKG
jgi:hypothetical protein